MLTKNIQNAYQDFYVDNDVAWRMLSAKYKAKNMVEVCQSIQPKKILEVGAGDGSILHFLNEWNFGEELYALEIAPSGVEKIKERNLPKLKEAQVFNGYQIPYGDNSFDLIILSHVLEHVEHERILIRELKRVAKHLVIEVPRDYRFGVDQRLSHFLAYGHINMYTPTLLRFLLKSEGLDIVADKSSLITPEVSIFNEFVNKKKHGSSIRKLKIISEYQIKKMLGVLLRKRGREHFANAYTILTKKSADEIKIF